MIAQVIKTIHSPQEGHEVLKAWRRFGNFMVSYVVEKRQEIQLVGVFSCTADSLERMKAETESVPVIRHGDDRVAA